MRGTAQVTALLEASYSTLFSRDYAPEVLARALPLITRANADLLSSGQFYVVEVSDGRLVGCGGWSREMPGTSATAPGLAHIRHFATHPAWLRKGVASRVFERCLEDAKAQITRRFHCFSSLPAVGFYRAMGFQNLRELDLRLTSEVSITAVIMERPIA